MPPTPPLRAASGQHFEDVLGQLVLDLSMPRDRLRDAGIGIAVPVVLGSMANQHTTELPDRLDQLGSLHATSSSPTLRIPGIVPPAMS